MKLSSFLVVSIAAVESTQIKTLLNRPEEDRKVPPRHPLQRLWRLYQYSEEIIQTHFYGSDIPEGKLDRMRVRIGKWMYLASRQSFLKCGSYNGIEADTIENEQSLLTNKDVPDDVEVPHELEIFDPRPPRNRRSDDDEDFNLLDNERYNREDPCEGIKQIMNGFRKWADRYLGSFGQCWRQQTYGHQRHRANKYYKIFSDGLNCPEDKLGNEY